jgi:hypothetical protein
MFHKIYLKTYAAHFFNDFFGICSISVTNTILATPFFINYSHKKKNGHLFLSVFKILPDFISLVLRKIIKYLL